MKCDSDCFRSIAQCARVRTVMTKQTGQILSLMTFLLNRRGLGDRVEDFFDLDCDDEGMCTRLFYVSRHMVDSFHKHGQFISMDATCKTNRFNMPLVLLVGLDDTCQTAIFGMSLILVEDIDSYIWILNRFKRAVGNTNNTPAFMVDTWYISSTLMVLLWCITSVSLVRGGNTP